mmetsp:Transcript_49901/g.139689  ORF Transcript_49901/g.139689 Transcript_49901/m.139689 type:complete len:81 (+) Transcript_49901:66-308(+)
MRPRHLKCPTNSVKVKSPTGPQWPTHPLAAEHCEFRKNIEAARVHGDAPLDEPTPARGCACKSAQSSFLPPYAPPTRKSA